MSSRAASRIRDLSASPHPDNRASPPNPSLSSPPPSKPPRSSYQAPTDARPDQPPPLPIEPYSITTISHGDGSVRILDSRRSESPLPPGMNSIPPPAIIRKQLGSASDVYYCTPAEMERMSPRGATRVLNEEGVFVDRASHSSLDSNSLPGIRPTLAEGTIPVTNYFLYM